MIPPYPQKISDKYLTQSVMGQTNNSFIKASIWAATIKLLVSSTIYALIGIKTNKNIIQFNKKEMIRINLELNFVDRIYK